MFVAVIILGILCLLLLALLAWKYLRPAATMPDASLMLKADLTQLTEQLGASNKQMAAQYAESAKIIRDVTQRLTELDKTNKNVGDIASELKTLQNVLQNPKQRGVVGEYYLEQILKNMLPPGSFQLQYRLDEGTTVDAVVILDKMLLPIDSKFSLENYNRLVEAKAEDRPPLEKLF